MILADILKNIEHRRGCLLYQYGTQEAASFHIANDPILNALYVKADQQAKEMQPRPSPAFGSFNYTVKFRVPVTDLLKPPSMVISHGTA